MLAHEVDAVGEQLERIHRAPAVPRIVGRMSGAAVKLDGEIDHGLAAVGVRLGLIPRVPCQHHVDVVEHAVARHVGLAADVLLGRRAVETNRALERSRLDLLLDRQRGAETRGAKHVVPAAMTTGARDQGLLAGLRLL